MKNKMKKLVLITLTMTGSLIQIGCGPLFCPGDACESVPSDSSYENSDYSYEKIKLDPTTLSKSARTEKVGDGLCQESRTEYLQLSDFELFSLAVESNVENCRIADYSNNNSVFCSAYTKIDGATWDQYGWPYESDAPYSTGCVDGYDSASITFNAIERIRDALRHPEDICGLCDPDRAITPEMVGK